MLLCVSALENGDGDGSAEAQALADASSWVLQLSGATGEWMMVCGIEIRCDAIFYANKHGRLIPPLSVSVLFFPSAPRSTYSLPRNSQQLNSLQNLLPSTSGGSGWSGNSVIRTVINIRFSVVSEFFLYWVEIIFCPRMQPWTGTGESHPPLLGTISVLVGSLSWLRYWTFSQSKLNKSTWLLLEISFC